MNRAEEQFLLFRIRATQDHDAFAKLYKEYLASTRRYLAYKLPGQEVDDCLLLVFERLWSYLKDAREVESIGGLIRTIAKTTIAEFYVKRSREPVIVSDTQEDGSSWLQHTAEDKGAERFIVSSAEFTLLRQKLDELKPEEYREVILLKFVDGMSTKQIGKRMQKSENAVLVTLHRALKALRKMYEQDDGRTME